MSILLSICITTRNRKESILRLLNELYSELTKEVNIVIVDGASTDGTQAIIEEFSKNNPAILYHYELINSGLDQGYDRCVTLATGRYCWMLSDDDQVVSGSIGLLLNIIRSCDYDLIVGNSEVWDKSLCHCLLNKQIKINQNTIFKSSEMNELFMMTASVLSFIGSVIIKREVWIKRDRERYYGSWFIHIGVIFQNALNKETLVIARPLIKIRYGIASWSGKSFDIWMKSWPTLIWSFPKISDKAKNSIVPRDPGRSLLKHLLYNCHNVDYSDAMSTVPVPVFLRRLFIRMIYIIPPKMCNAIVGIGCYLTREKRLLILYDVANCKSAGLVSQYLLRRVLSHY
jgi:glycosyltransferase involved in cell wall biosynthesis